MGDKERVTLADIDRWEDLPAMLMPVEVADVICVSELTVVKMCKEGVLPAHKIGGRWRVPTRRLLEKYGLLKGDSEPAAPPSAASAARVPPCILTVLDYVKGRGGHWKGTASQLIVATGLNDVPPNVLSRLLRTHRAFLMDNGVRYSFAHRQNQKTIRLDVRTPEAEPPADDAGPVGPARLLDFSDLVQA